jgi:tRNA threonylcarbamoyladenosine biosynthesis protein TsaE
VSPILTENVIDLISNSVEQTRRLGARFGELAQAGDLLCLEGELGTGKTAFVQGLARGLGIAPAVHSPTFIMANEYRGGRLVLNHLDVYRVGALGEAIGIGLDDYLYGDGVTVIEWAEKIRALVPPEHLWITFRHLAETKRALLITPRGERYENLAREFRARAFGT